MFNNSKVGIFIFGVKINNGVQKKINATKSFTEKNMFSKFRMRAKLNLSLNK